MMNSDFARLARFFPTFVDAFAYNDDGSLNPVVGFNQDNYFVRDRPVAQLQSLLQFLISQLDFDLFGNGVQDRRTQMLLGEILANTHGIVHGWETDA